MMNIEQQKLAVCEKLPELIGQCPSPASGHYCFFWHNQTEFHGKEDEEVVSPVNWDREGLQVCHEAEKLLPQNLHLTYSDCILPSVYQSSFMYTIIGATYQQRLEALCRVWFPEKFK